MSVSARLNPLVLLGCLVAVALVAGAAVWAGFEADDVDDARDPVTLRTPAAAVGVIDSATPAQSANEVATRLFSHASLVVIVARHDREAQRRGIADAASRGIPVLVSDPSLPRALKRLGTDAALVSGRVRAVSGLSTKPVTGVAGGKEPTRRMRVLVVTRSREANAVAVATARIGGARVVEARTGDVRTDRAAASVLREHARLPVVGLGRPFAGRLPYQVAVVRKGAEQQGGGYLALPGRHYTATYGHPGAPSLGVLGEQGVKASVARVERLARKYRRASRATYVPTFEIIATVASGGAGKDGNYSNEVSIATLRPLVDAAEKAGVYVVLDLQPGRSDFLTQARRYRRLLARPHVGLALDPEWRLTEKQKPLRQIGSVNVAEINRTAAWLARLTRQRVLPQKLFVVHQFSTSMIRHRSRLETDHPELATVIHVDGSGPQGAKQGTWKAIREDAPSGVFWGWKNFVDEDDPMLDVRQTLRQVRPRPDLVTYQ